MNLHPNHPSYGYEEGEPLDVTIRLADGSIVGENHEVRIVETELGRFRKVGGPTVVFLDRWTFECPGCGQWAYLDDDQWHGRVSVDHASDGCTGGYHETHDYFAVLEAACNDPDAKVTP